MSFKIECLRISVNLDLTCNNREEDKFLSQWDTTLALFILDTLLSQGRAIEKISIGMLVSFLGGLNLAICYMLCLSQAK